MTGLLVSTVVAIFDGSDKCGNVLAENVTWGSGRAPLSVFYQDDTDIRNIVALARLEFGKIDKTRLFAEMYFHGIDKLSIVKQMCIPKLRGGRKTTGIQTEVHLTHIILDAHPCMDSRIKSLGWAQTRIAGRTDIENYDSCKHEWVPMIYSAFCKHCNTTRKP